MKPTTPVDEAKALAATQEVKEVHDVFRAVLFERDALKDRIVILTKERAEDVRIRREQFERADAAEAECERLREKKTPQWTEGQPPWTDGDALLFQVDTNEGVQTFVGRVDGGGTMVDMDYGDDFGWESHSVSRWIKLDALMETFDERELPPWSDETEAAEDAAPKGGE